MMLKCFIDLGILSPQQCGTVTTHFKAFLDEKLKMFCADFDGFSRDCFQLVMVKQRSTRVLATTVFF